MRPNSEGNGPLWSGSGKEVRLTTLLGKIDIILIDVHTVVVKRILIVELHLILNKNLKFMGQSLIAPSLESKRFYLMVLCDSQYGDTS